MKKSALFAAAGTLFLFSVAVSVLARQEQSRQGTPVSVIVTAEPRRGKAIPPLTAQDVAVTQDHDKRPVKSLEPLSGTKLQLLLMIDDSAAGSFNTELQTLKNFVMALPANTEVAIGYMRNGMTKMTADFTGDHAAAAKTIRAAMGPGGGDSSPYDALTDAVKKWPRATALRREIVMISSGIEALGGGVAPENPYVNAGIAAAQKAGVVVYTIYNPSVGHAGHSFWRGAWGQDFLSQLSDETGGEFYVTGFGSPVSFEPYLKAILAAQQHQYLLTFVARAEEKAGLQAFRTTVIDKDASLAAPDKVFVRAGL
jgi:hypothetical protein